MGIGVFFPEGKAGEVWSWLSTSAAEVKNEWKCTSAPSSVPSWHGEGKLYFCTLKFLTLYKIGVSAVLGKVKVFWGYAALCICIYSYRRFGGTGCFSLQSQRCPRLFFGLPLPWRWQQVSLGFLITTFQSARRHMPEDLNLKRLYCFDTVKSGRWVPALLRTVLHHCDSSEQC